MSTLRDVLVWCTTSVNATDPTPLDWTLIGLGAALVLGAFYAAVRHTFWPGETDPAHIKWRILDEEDGR